MNFMNQSKVSRILTINNFYLIYALLMILLIIDSKSMLDILYFLVISFYYIRIKIYQKRVEQHHFI